MSRASHTVALLQGQQTLIDQLVAQAQQEAPDRADAEALRMAFGGVLEKLQVDPSEMALWRDGTDIVGRAYERLLSGQQRRAAGQFYTPLWAGELMAGWLFEQPRKLVVDPGVGSGALLIAAARHSKRRDAQLLGVDLDPLALKMLNTNTRVRDIQDINGVEANFLLDDLDEAPDGIICNPPYSRHHHIPTGDKLAIHDGFEDRLGLNLSRRAALHALFLVRALEVAAPRARLAFITPSEWLDVGYGRKIKAHLLASATVDAIVLLESEHLFFDGVLTTAAITFIRNETPDAGRATRVLRLGKNLPTPEAVLKQLQSSVAESVVLEAKAKWSRPRVSVRRGVPLGDVARVRRGIATGCNSFFVISEAKRKELGLSVKQLRPCLTSPRIFAGTELTTDGLKNFGKDIPRWVLNVREEAEIDTDTALGRYLRYGRDQLNADESHLAAKRNPWYAPERRGDCPILSSYFSRSRPRFVRNRTTAVPLNNWLIIEPKPGVDADVLFAALMTQTVNKQLEERARVYARGLRKLEPSELSEIRLNDKRVRPGT